MLVVCRSFKVCLSRKDPSQIPWAEDGADFIARAEKALGMREEVDDDDVIHAPAARRAAELAALGAECITLSLSLGTPARGHRGRGGGVTLDASLRGRA